VKDVGVVVIV